MALSMLLVLATWASCAPAQIKDTSPAVDDATRAALLQAACDGEIEDGNCDTDLLSDAESSWHLGTVYVGHFLSPESEDAMVTVRLNPGFSPLRYSTMALLMSKREGEWKTIDGPSLIMNFDECRMLHFRDKRDFLVCMLEDYAQFVGTKSLLMVWGAEEAMKVKVLLEATDDTAACNSDRTVEKASIDRVDFVDRNKDGWLDLAVGVRHGKMVRTPKQQEQCQAEEPWKEHPKYPEPVLRRYRIELLFDETGFTPTPASRQIVKTMELKER